MELFLSDILKEEPKEFLETYGEKVCDKLLSDFENDVAKDMIPLPAKSIGKLKQPFNHFLMPFGYFYDMINAKANIETYENINIVTACFYRADWSKPYNAQEILETAEWLEGQTLMFSLWGMILLDKLSNDLREVYPDLYEGIDNTKDDERRVYELMNGLADNKVWNYDKVRNATLADTMQNLIELKNNAKRS